MYFVFSDLVDIHVSKPHNL